MYVYNIYVYIYIYPQTRVSSSPGLINVAQVNELRTTDVTRVLKAPGTELCQNACGVVNEQKIFCSHQCFPVFKDSVYLSIYLSIYIYIYTFYSIKFLVKYNLKSTKALSIKTSHQ